MDPSTYSGRKVQKQILASLLSRALGVQAPQGSSADAPRLFLFFGESGLGKSTLIDICGECVDEIAAAGKAATTLLLDLDAWRFRNGMLPNTITRFLDALYAVAVASEEYLSSALAPYGALNSHLAQVETRKKNLISVDWPRQLFLSEPPAAKTASRDKTAADFAAWIAGQMEVADLALCDNPEEHLTESFASCLINASRSLPFTLMIDNVDLIAATPVASWLKSKFLPLLLSEKAPIAVILGCSDALARSYRNAFADELVYPVSLASIPFTSNDIASMAANRNISLTQELTEQIEQMTAGMPIAAKIAVDASSLNVPPSDIFSKKSAVISDSDRLANDCFERFVKTLGNERDRSRIISTVLLYRMDENILSQVWEIPPEEVVTALTDLAVRYSFMEGRRPHEAMYDRLLAYLLTEASHTAESSLAEVFKKFSEISGHIHDQYLSHMRSDKPDGRTRYADPNFQITLIGSLKTLLWAKQEDAVKALPGLFIETLHYHPEFAPTLLAFADDCAPLLTQETTKVIETLKDGLPVAQTLALPIGSAKRGVQKALDFMKPYEAGLDLLQQGLLSRMRGILYCQAGNYDKAMDAFAKCESLFSSQPIEFLQLFENYCAAACAFVAAEEMGKAAVAFGKAAGVKPDDYFARFRLGLAYQELRQHQNAIASFEEAIKIDGTAVPSFIELGIEYATINNHEQAVAAFTRATEIDAHRPIAWFKLGLSLEALGRYAEAEKALTKTVEILPEHWEAFFALGRSQSAQGSAQEAISSLSTVVELKADCTDAWKSLGKELHGVHSYERAAASLEKAVELDPTDSAMWALLGNSWYGANSFEKAVNASQKAVGMKDDFFDAWVTLGQSHTELSNFKEAHSAFAKAAALNPMDEEIWVNVGNSLYAQGKYEESIVAFQKAAEFHPDVDSIWHNIGLAFQVQQFHEKAIEAFAKAVAINPNSADSWYQQGRSFAELNRHTEAAESFSKTVELSPDAQDAWYRKGLSLSKIGNHADAITTLIKASELNPTDADIWNQMGLSCVATSKAEDAVRAFSQAITLAPNRPEVHFQLGLALESLARFEEAIGAYRKAIELSPDKAEAWYHCGLCHNFLLHYEEALPALHKALDLAPKNSEVFMPIALAAHAVNKYDEAVEFYKKELGEKPDSEEAMYNLALALHAMNNFAEALPAYQAVVQKWPGKDQAWYNMGLAYHAAGDFNQAVTSYREAARINPDSPEIWYHMGLVFYATEHYGEAIQAFRKVISRAPDMYEAWFNIGNAYLVWHEFNDAIEAYEKAVLLKPDDYSSWGYLGSAYYGAGRYDKAAESCGKAFALKSDEPWIINSLALSRLLSGDAAGATPLFEALIAADDGGQEIGRAISEIEKALSKNPALTGAREIIAKLSGDAPIENAPMNPDSPQ
jgi:tetratricopeptide (TPR) repeat protein